MRIMPSLRTILHKCDDLSTTQPPQNAAATPQAPKLMLIRTDTHTREIIIPPSNPHDPSPYLSSPTQEESTSPRRSFQLFSRSPRPSSPSSQSPPRREHRLSNLLHLDSRSRSGSRDSSANIPADLPQIDDDRGTSKQEREALWEARATVLVQQNPQFAQSGSSLPGRQGEGEASLSLGPGLEQTRSRSSSQTRVGMDPNEDVGACCFCSFCGGSLCQRIFGLTNYRLISKRLFGCMKLVVSIEFHVGWKYMLIDLVSRSRAVNSHVRTTCRSKWRKQSLESGSLWPRTTVRPCLATCLVSKY